MFLEKLQQDNPQLIDYAFKLHREGLILPDSYILDYDTIKENAQIMKKEADKNKIELFFMLKQLGRNPLIAKMLQEIGYPGVVAVDYKEALLMIDNGIKLGNVGHLEQIPKSCLKKIISNKPEIITVYSWGKIKEINDVAKQLQVVQPLMLRLTDEDSQLYSGQIAGFGSNELENIIEEASHLSNVKIAGLTVFPALLYDDKIQKIVATDNMKVMNRGIEICKKAGLKDLMINLPSATCCASLETIKELGGNCGEPGHGLTGTTPLHKNSNQPEKTAYCYVSEISHNYKDKSYCYGGGVYRRGHLENVLVGKSLNQCEKKKISIPDLDSIDYHLEIDGNCQVSDCCIMCFRTQIFTTRSHVVVVKGLKTDNPQIMGIYDSLGRTLETNWR